MFQTFVEMEGKLKTMRKTARKIYEKTSIEKNKDTQRAIEYITYPDRIESMLEATASDKPALSGIVKGLEDRFANCEGFPLNHDAPDKNAKNRRNVGWFVRYAMAYYGYAPISNSERTRIGTDSKSKYFGSAAVYEKVEDVPEYEIINQSFEVDRTITQDDLWADESDDDYILIRESIREIVWKRNMLELSDAFIAEFLNHIGYKNLLSESDVRDIFNGMKIPRIELYEAIDRIFSLFGKCKVKNKRQYHEIMGMSTDSAVKAYYECGIDPETVTDVHVYFSTWDPIMDNKYNLLSEGDDDKNKEILLDAPRFIITTKDGTEYWFHGLTCGYAGQGCGGTQEILLHLGIIEEDQYYVNYEIQTNRCLHYFKKNGKWTYQGQESRYDLYYEKLRDNADFHVFMYNDNLTVSQSYRYQHRFSRMLDAEEPEYEWFTASMFFIGKPTEVELVKVEEDDGRVLRAPVTTPSYQVVIRNKNANRELWLDYPFNDIPDDRRDNLYKFFDEIGVRIPREYDKNALIKRRRDIYKVYPVGETKK